MRVLNILRRIQRDASTVFKRLAFGVSKPEVRLIVVGAQKGGTTSLYYYLSAHPDIDVPVNKEINYFSSLGSKSGSLTEYQKQFPIRFARNAGFYSIDVSPTYLLDAELTAKKIFDLNPAARIAVVLREPVSRAVSSWFMYKKLYAQNPDWFVESTWVKNNTSKRITRRKKTFGLNFEEDIEEEILVLESGGRIEYPIVEYGLYKQQLENFIDVFDHQNLLILSSALLQTSTQQCLDQVTSFMGIAAHKLEQHQLIPHFVGDNKEVLNTSSLSKLADYYQVQNSGLEKLLGEGFKWSISET